MMTLASFAIHFLPNLRPYLARVHLSTMTDWWAKHPLNPIRERNVLTSEIYHRLAYHGPRGCKHRNYRAEWKFHARAFHRMSSWSSDRARIGGGAVLGCAEHMH